jgi:hypothetical protein
MQSISTPSILVPNTLHCAKKVFGRCVSTSFLKVFLQLSKLPLVKKVASASSIANNGKFWLFEDVVFIATLAPLPTGQEV